MATILCIDDNLRVLETHKALLESEGYTILTAPDGPTGIALASTKPVDAVVLDFNMPDMKGDQVAEALIREHPNLPVVIWSGCPDDVPEWLKWYADALLHKGDGPDSLISAVEKIVSAREANKKPPSRTICRETVGRRSPCAGRDEESQGVSSLMNGTFKSGSEFTTLLAEKPLSGRSNGHVQR